MTRLLKNTGEDPLGVVSDGPVADEASNAVIQQQEDLREAFSPETSEFTAAATPFTSLISDPNSPDQKLANAFECCVKPLLIALNWSGESRHLIEAHPHASSIGDICQFAALMVKLGFNVRLYNDSLTKLQESQLPCMAILPDGFPCVVFELHPGGKAQILRGSDGAMEEIDLTDGRYHFCLFSFRDDSEAPQDKKGNWFYESFLNFKQQIFAVGLVTLLINLMGLATPLYIMTVYDKVFTASALDTLIYLAVGICLIIGAELYLRSVRGKLVAFVGARFTAVLLSESFGKILGFQISMTESASISSQLMRIKQFQAISGFFSGKVANAALDFPFIIIFCLVIAAIGGPLIWVPVCLAIAFLVIGLITVPLTKRNIALTGKARSKSQNFLLETMEISTTVRQLDAEAIWNRRYEEYLSQLTHLKFKSQFFDSVLNSISQGLVMIAGIATLWIGTLLVLAGDLSTGALIAIMMLVWKVLSPIQTLFLSFSNITQMSDSVRQVNQLMRLATERPVGQSSGIFRNYFGKIRFENVGFRYTPKSEPVARGVSIDFRSRAITALTGSNSSGKSTLLKFIIGLYTPQAGGVFVDGLNLKQIDPGELRASIAYVTQDPIFFYGTVAQNIRLYQPTASDDEVANALVDAGIDIKDRETFPEGVETRLSGRFLEGLPEGLRQRLSLARAYAKQSKVYLFDEPFALLDPEGRECFSKKINELKNSATIIMATNDVEQLNMCDRIVYLSQGSVIASGTPEKILPLIQDQQNP
ncbi:MAG: ATP-binding cassette domain-containing protein [Rhizobiaceae bacterium]